MTPADWIALGTLVFTVLSAIVGLTWGVGKITSQVQSQIHRDLERYKTSLTAKVEALEESIAVKELAMERKSGELGNALRTKVSEVELYIRDNYVRSKDMDALMKLFTDRMDRLQNGVDRLNERMNDGGS